MEEMRSWDGAIGVREEAGGAGVKRGEESSGREQCGRARQGGHAGRVSGRSSIDNNLEGNTEDIPLAPMFCEGIRYEGRGGEMRAKAEDRRKCLRTMSRWRNARTRGYRERGLAVMGGDLDRRVFWTGGKRINFSASA
jgi:hypothetical protein